MAEKRIRPGSTGEAISKVDTTGSRVAQAVSQARLRITGMAEAIGVNWPVALGPKQPEEGPRQEAKAEPYAPYAADDRRMLKRLFGIDVRDI